MANYELYRDCYEDLANAIIVEAARDYRKAYRRYKKGDETALYKIRKIEKFFNSEWADLLCNDKAKNILERLQKEQETKTKRVKRTVKIK